MQSPRRVPGFSIVLFVTVIGHACAALLYAHLIVDETARRAVYFGSKVVINAIPLVWMFAMERRPFRWPHPTRRAVMLGLAWGLVIAGAILVFHGMFLEGKLESQALRAKAGAYGALDHFFLFAVFLCVANSGMEEYYWRWFVFRGFRRYMGPMPAAVASALGFTLHHIVVLAAYFPDVSLVVMLNVGVFVGGFIWAILYERSANICAPWLSHLLADAAIMWVAYGLLFGT